MIGYYILDSAGNPVEEPDLLTWARWFEGSNASAAGRGRFTRQLARDTHNGVMVSTVFLGMDHNCGDGPPILWETMIFGGPHGRYQERYTTRAEALEGHRRACALAWPVATMTVKP